MSFTLSLAQRDYHTVHDYRHSTVHTVYTVVEIDINIPYSTVTIDCS